MILHFMGKKIERKVSDNIVTALDSAVNTLFPTENVILSLDNDIFWKYEDEAIVQKYLRLIYI